MIKEQIEKICVEGFTKRWVEFEALNEESIDVWIEYGVLDTMKKMTLGFYISGVLDGERKPKEGK